MTPRRSITEKRWTRGFTVAFLAFAAAVMFIALPACSSLKTTIVDVKDNAGNVHNMKIKVDEANDNVSATVDGIAMNVTKKIPFPVKLGDHSRSIGAIYPGPMIVFEGSSCVWVKNRWIAYPPGTPCP
jgi:ribosomal protein L14